MFLSQRGYVVCMLECESRGIFRNSKYFFYIIFSIPKVQHIWYTLDFDLQ